VFVDKSKSPRADELKTSPTAKIDKSPRKDSKGVKSESQTLAQNTTKESNQKEKEKEKEKQKEKIKEKDKEGPKPSKIPRERQKEKEKETDIDRIEAKEKLKTSSSPRSAITSEGSLTPLGGNSSSSPLVVSTASESFISSSQGPIGENDAESSDLDWQGPLLASILNSIQFITI
jgi:hypothetical protein